MTKNRIAELRAERGRSIAKLAEAVNSNVSQIHRLERGERQLTQRWMERLGDALGVPPEAIIRGADTRSEPVRDTRQAQEPRDRLFRPGSALPVLGNPMPGLGEYLFLGGAMDHVARPRPLEQNARAYAAYVHDDSMAPRYLVGECLYLAPGLPPRPGTYVMLRHVNGRGQLRMLKAMTPEAVVVITHNPVIEETVSRAEIESIDAVALSGMAAPA